MIPKIIHFCWLSTDPYPLLIQQCMRRWHKLLPDYKFRLWDTQRFPLEQSEWVRQAYEHKKYAFAADYIRAYALYTEGGWYFDSDIWLKKDISCLLNDRFVSCIECTDDNTDCSIQAAFLGSEARHPFMKDILDYYNSRSFVLSDGTLCTSPIAPTIYAQVAVAYGFQAKNEEQMLKEGIHLYDKTLCAPNRSAESSNSFAIHFCEHSWHDTTWSKRLAHNLRGLGRALRIYLSH